jgi:hypothetical protein
MKTCRTFFPTKRKHTAKKGQNGSPPVGDAMGRESGIVNDVMEPVR